MLSGRFRVIGMSAMIAALLLAPVSNLRADIRDGLVGYWNLDGDAIDGSQNSNDGILTGDVDFSDDVPDLLGSGFSATFDGDGDFIDLGASPDLNFGTTDFTVSAWLKTTQTDRGSIFSNGGDDGGGIRYVLSQGENNALKLTLTTDDNSDKERAEGDTLISDGEWHHVLSLREGNETRVYVDGAEDGQADLPAGYDLSGTSQANAFIGAGFSFANTTNIKFMNGLIDDVAVWEIALDDDTIAGLADGTVTFGEPIPFVINGGGETYLQDFDEALGVNTGRLPEGWSGVVEGSSGRRIDGLGLTDGFLTVPGDENDGVLGLLNLGGNTDSFGPAPDGFVPAWTAELAGPNPADPLFGRDDVIADNATDRALGIGRENNDDPGELNFEIEIASNTMRAFVVDWDLEVWGGDPDGSFRSSEGPGMAVDVTVGATSYATMTANLLPGDSFDSIEDGNSDHNATLIDGNVHSVRGMTTGIKEVSAADGAVGNTVQLNFNANWNGADAGPDGWFSAIDNVRLRALAPGDADANGVVDVTDLLQLLGGQKFNQGVDGVTWEQGDFNADDQFDTGDLLAMLSFLSGTFPSDPYASEAGGANDAVADIIVNSETGEVTVDLAGHTVSAVIIESASEIFNGSQPQWDTTSQFPSTLPGELGNVLFTSTASGVDELGAVISAEFLDRDKEFYLQDLDLNILIASEGGALTKGNVIVVPEPSTWLMLGLGSLLFVGWRQAKRSPGKQ